MATVPPLAKIAVGAFHSAIVTDSFYSQVEKDSQTKTQTSLFTWGTNQYGVLGTGEPEYKGNADAQTPERPTPTLVNAPANTKWRPTEVGCGTHHTIVLNKPLDVEGGTVFAAGLGTRGRLGFSESGSSQVEDVWWSPTFVKVPVPQDVHVIRIAVGSDHAFALSQHGQVYAWGANSDGQCGCGNGVDVRKPTLVPFVGDTRIRHMAAGARHSLFCDSTGSTYACGYGANGRLGVGDIDTRYTPARLEEPAGLRCTFVCVGEAHSGMIDSAGEVYTWGIGSFGRLGTGETKDSLVPQRVNALEGNRCTFLSMGTFHSLACTFKGKIFAWGSGIVWACLQRTTRRSCFSLAS
jgi:alpha-tubulin suppressor-like RCC1 family protein